MSKGTLKNVRGDVTQPQKIDPNRIVIIPHCCNTLGVMGAGVALALRKKWPEVYDTYKANSMGLGTVSFADVEDNDKDEIMIIVANMIGQYRTVSPDNPKPVKYLALGKAMAEIVEFADMRLSGVEKVEIHCPKFGSDLANGDWRIILELIREIWLENGIDVVVYEWEADKDKWGEISD